MCACECRDGERESTGAPSRARAPRFSGCALALSLPPSHLESEEFGLRRRRPLQDRVHPGPGLRVFLDRLQDGLGGGALWERGQGEGMSDRRKGRGGRMRRQGRTEGAQRPAPRPPSSLASNPARGWACRPGPRISPRWTGRGQHAAVGVPGAVRVHGAPLARSRAPSLGALGVVCAPPSPPRWSRPRNRRPPSRPAGPRPWAGRSRAGGPRARRRAGRRRPCCYLGDGRAEG